MSEAKAKSTENKSASANKTTKEKADVVSRQVNKVEKLKWTLERCQKFARRYPNEAVWSSCHSSSYKAAVAHGWKAACLNQSTTSSSHSSSNNSAKKAA